MDRRKFLTALRGEPVVVSPKTNSPTFLPGLDPYTGAWGFEQAAHLLRRTIYGPNQEAIQWAVENGLNATLEKLFEELPLPSPPLNYKYNDDLAVSVGSSWVSAPYSRNGLNDELGYRNRSLLAWTIGLTMQEGISIREKLTLFWHNHFAINSVNDPKYLYRYSNLLRQYALGNFRDLTKAITVDPAMLFFLNGNVNRKLAPNENYARELLELFTIGKGPLIGPGDYTNYTEEDVREMAKILTGWRDSGFTLDRTDGMIEVTFQPSEHNEGIKTLSYHFDNAVIDDKGAEEYKYLIDIIFGQFEVARFISRKLYQWFVYYEIDESVEAEVIQPMAWIIFDNDFEIKPGLIALLGSEHFFDNENVGSMIKNPLDFVISAMKILGVKVSDNLDEMYDSWYRLAQLLDGLQMKHYDIPQVAGWLAYYRHPLFYRNWINATTLPRRNSILEDLLAGGVFPFEANGSPMKVDILSFFASIGNPLDPNELINKTAALLFPKPLPPNRVASLKQILLPGLPDYEWGVEFGTYLDNPNNSDLASSVTTKLTRLLLAMLKMPHFNLS